MCTLVALHYYTVIFFLFTWGVISCFVLTKGAHNSTLFAWSTVKHTYIIHFARV